MRWRTPPKPTFRRRLLLVPMRFGNTWHWLEMVRTCFWGTHTEVMTEAEYQQSGWKVRDDARMRAYERGEE